VAYLTWTCLSELYGQMGVYADSPSSSSVAIGRITILRERSGRHSPPSCFPPPPPSPYARDHARTLFRADQPGSFQRLDGKNAHLLTLLTAFARQRAPRDASRRIRRSGCSVKHFCPEGSSTYAQLATTCCTGFRTEGVPLVCLNQCPRAPLQHKLQSRFC
jgi:hypothetical protein